MRLLLCFCARNAGFSNLESELEETRYISVLVRIRLTVLRSDVAHAANQSPASELLGS